MSRCPLRDPVALTVIAFVSGALIGGCLGTAEVDPGEPEEYVEEDLNKVNLTRVEKLVILEPTENKTVRISGLTYRNIGVTINCPHPYDSEEFGDQYQVWVKVWNRTGVVYYAEETLQGPLRSHGDVMMEEILVDLVWPEPPYIVWVGANCAVDATYEFHAHDWLIGVHENRDMEERFFGIWGSNWLTKDIEVPLGQSRGEITFPMHGEYRYRNSVGARLDSVEGHSFGSLLTYEPSRADDPDDWTSRVNYRPAGIVFNTWDLVRGPVAQPGDWLVAVELDHPAILPTTWTVFMSSYSEFLEEPIQEIGFVYPFALHTPPITLEAPTEGIERRSTSAPVE